MQKKKKEKKKKQKSFSFFDNCIWIGSYKFFLLVEEYL